MSERRYTVTEGQYNALLDILHAPCTAWESNHGMSDAVDACYRGVDIMRTLTPDPVESGAEVVSRLYDIDGMSVEMVAEVMEVLTAEVTRQVEERTMGYREALETISREFGTNPSFGEDILGRVMSRICTTTRQALANKGGSDD